MRLFFFFPLPFIALGIVACSKNSTSATPDTPGGSDTTVTVVKDTTPQTRYDITQLEYCLSFATIPVVDTMQRQEYNELSGIASSVMNPGVLYVHEDNAGTNTIPLTNAHGDDLGKLVLDNISTRNIEDIRVAPGPEAGKSYIYLADIGDNNASRKTITVYRFVEPVLKDLSGSSAVHIQAIDKIELAYPKNAVNAETLLVDPVTKDIFVASKETSRSTIYTATYPQSLSNTTVLKAVVKTDLDLLTSGDISPDGSEILLRNKGQIWYWKRTAGQSVAQAILMAPQTAPYAGNEHQGEGICFMYDGGGYVTDTEIKDHPGAVSTISFYKRK
ncbi:hypothetical protein [Pinibacter aurantiacus]|uniref:Lipoprotein n=1 Tax=Pinibacter aurantiacus TaxID=2851599 RepID=A0A9E2SAE0_9BACT|nr:hypothetical protein [Pinibacter aurantiacus]MBV4357584.1 hypothetical protein [Pinibacter aurantiacus]